VYIRPKMVRPFSGPCISRGYVHRAVLLCCFHDPMRLSDKIISFTDQNTTAFKEVAIIRHPRIGEYAFGFITSTVVLQVLDFLYIHLHPPLIMISAALYCRLTNAMKSYVACMCQQIICILVTYFW
jgi:hypothetical protein